MIDLFKLKHKENDATRIYKIYKNIDKEERINYIVHSEYKRMIFLAEKAALNGEVSFIFDLSIEDLDMKNFNVIMNKFMTLISENGFRYSREIVIKENRFTIYFSELSVWRRTNNGKQIIG